MKVDLKPFSLKEILEQVQSGQIQLPEFQREYVWKTTQKTSLLSSILKGYPIGSVLLLELDEKKPLFAWTELNGIDFIDDNRRYTHPKKSTRTPPDYLILDGQQRITTLAQTIFNPLEAKTYYIDIHKIFDFWRDCGSFINGTQIDNWVTDLDFEDFISSGKYNPDPKSKLNQKKRKVPFTLLLDNSVFESAKAESIVKISTDITTRKARLKKAKADDKNRIKHQISEGEAELQFFTHVLSRVFGAFFEFTIPSVVVPKAMSVEGVCKIFTSTNTSGIKLGAYDLCIATLYPQDIGLKQLFEESLQKYPLIDAVDRNAKTYVLQYMALKNGKNPKTASLPRNILPEFFGKSNIDWFKCTEEFNEAINVLDTYCGSSLVSGNDKCLVYSPLIPPLAFVLAEFPIDDTLNAKEKKTRIDKVKAWYFSAAVSNRYGEGSDNKQERDISTGKQEGSMRDWFEKTDYQSEKPKWIKEPKFNELHTQGNGAMGKAMRSILSSNGAVDFWDENHKVGHHSKSDLHHIFPKAFMKSRIKKDRAVDDKTAAKILVNEIVIDSNLNLTYLKDSTNRDEIRDKAPSLYFKELLDSHTSEAAKKEFKSMLENHLIDDECLRALLADDYDAFISRRKALFRQKFEALGVENFVEDESELVD